MGAAAVTRHDTVISLYVSEVLPSKLRFGDLAVQWDRFGNAEVRPQISVLSLSTEGPALKAFSST